MPSGTREYEGIAAYDFVNSKVTVRLCDWYEDPGYQMSSNDWVENYTETITFGDFLSSYPGQRCELTCDVEVDWSYYRCPPSCVLPKPPKKRKQPKPKKTTPSLDSTPSRCYSINNSATNRANVNQTKGDKIMPKLDAVPAVNKEGFSRVTFEGLEDGCKEYEVTDKETGEVTKAKREYTKLKFTILDKTKVSPITANVVGQTLNTKDLWSAVQGLGYTNTDVDTLEDGDDTLDDEPTEVGSELEAIVNFLESVKGKKYICKVERDKKGFWSLKTDTLAPFIPVTK